VLNFLALLGWAYDDKTELFTPEELIKAFTLDRVGIAGGIYDPAKLTWMNGVYIRQLSLDDLTQRTIPYLERPEAEGGLPGSVQRPLNCEYTSRVLQLEQERLKTLGEAASRVAFFYTDALSYDAALLVQKKMDVAGTRVALMRARDLLASLETWTHEAMEAPMSDLAIELGLSRGQLFGTVRVAVSGSTATPPLFQMMEVLGRERCMARIAQAIAKLA
jgi:glutamyl-tRNA synthetase